MSECEACDFRLWPCQCWCVVSDQPTLCILKARGRDDFRRLIAELTLGEAAAPPKPCCGQA